MKFDFPRSQLRDTLAKDAKVGSASLETEAQVRTAIVLLLEASGYGKSAADLIDRVEFHGDFTNNIHIYVKGEGNQFREVCKAIGSIRF